LGIGAYLGYATNKYKAGDYGWNFNHLIIGARGALHYQLVDKLDTYAGLMLGYDAVSSSLYGTNQYNILAPTPSALGLSLFIGARYYFSDNTAAFAELGYGIALLQLGVSFKF
jgi:hypothetical protein